MFRRRLRVGREGLPKYKGDANKICSQILDKCWNGKYLQTSGGHFTGFYARDFGWCAPYLLKLGKKEWVRKTLEYSLSVYVKNGIKTAITPDGKVFDFPNYYCIDAVAYMFYALRLLGDKKLILKYKDFLQAEIYKFDKKTIDPKTGMVKKNKYFSSMKDCSLREGSCYDNVMVALLDDELQKLKVFDNPLSKYKIKDKIKKEFWTGKYFKNDTSADKTVTGDSNMLPFWTGVVVDKKMLRSVLMSVHKAGLDKPWPLKYVHKPVREHKMIFVELFAQDWEQDSIWSMMGMMYVDVVSGIDKKKARSALAKYKKVIEEHKNFLEVYDTFGEPYHSPFYVCDDSMSWVCMYLVLAKRLKL